LEQAPGEDVRVTILMDGLVMTVLAGPAIIVMPAGLGILATKFYLGKEFA